MILRHISGRLFHCDVPIRHPDCSARSWLHVGRCRGRTEVPICADMGKAAGHGAVEKGSRADVLLPGDQVSMQGSMNCST